MSAGEQQAATSFGDPNARPPTPLQSPTAVSSSTLPQTPKQTPGTIHLDEAASGWTPRFAEEYSVFNSTPGNLRGSGSAAAFANNHLDFALLSPVPPSTGKKRPLSAEVPAINIAAHVSIHSATGSATVASVDPVRQLLSSPEPLVAASKENTGPGLLDGTPRGVQPHKQTQAKGLASPLPPLPQQQQQRAQKSNKKSRQESISAAPPGCSEENAGLSRTTQTATPPPSSRGGRKLAPRVQMENIQSQSFGQADFSQPQQPHLDTSFVGGSPDDVFGYAVGPASAPPGTEDRPFWGMNMDASAMSIDVDLAAAGADLFQTISSQGSQSRGLTSIDWGRPNQVFQQTEMVVQPHQEQQQQPQPSPHLQSQGQERRQSKLRRDRPLAPKTAAMSNAPNFGQTTPNQQFSFESFQMSMDDPFGASPGGVDPGLLFGAQVTTAGMDSNVMSTASMPLQAAPRRPTSSAPAIMGQASAGLAPEPTLTGVGNDTRLGSASRGSQRRLSECPSNAISPIKNAGKNRMNMSRSFSESARGGKRTVGGSKNPLPTLAPAKPVTVHQPSLPPPPGNPSNRPHSQNGRNGGRTSPLKASHHHRLSSLSSIPENAANFPSRSQMSASSAKKTSVKFVIDENGRARAETVRDNSADDEYDVPEPYYTSFSSSLSQPSRTSWGGVFPAHYQEGATVLEGEYSSSEDDEPIIIPSRNTSFSYPEPPRTSSSGGGTSRPPTASSILSSHNRSVRQRSISGDRYSTTSSSSFRRLPPLDDAEVLDYMMDMDGPPRSQGSRPSTGGSLGDAAAELRKVMQGVVNPRRTSSTSNPHHFLSGKQRLTPSGQRSSSSTISEASLSMASPTHHPMDQIRCICNRPEAEVDGVQFLVKCDSCECLLHGRCVDVATPQDLPHVYVCAFCANTPNMRGGRMRYTGRTGAGGGHSSSNLMGPPVTTASTAVAAMASSPLAHKSFRSFR